jgi:hypothetical protein
LLERTRPYGHVKLASGVVGKRPRTNRHVVKTVSIVSKRIQAELSCARSPPRDKLQRFCHYLAAFLATILSRSFVQSEL